MTFSTVLLFCLGGIAVCSALVFVVETLVAFCLHEKQEPMAPSRAVARTVYINRAQREPVREMIHEEAA